MLDKQIISAIDIGTNSFHMVTAVVDSNGSLEIISKDKEIVRLGSSGGDMKYITSDAMKRGIRTLRNFAEIARNYNADIRAVATSAVREALNKDEFLEKARHHAGVEVEVVSGLEEARLIGIGVNYALPIYEKHSLIIDIGGGSTETVITHRGETDFLHSAKLGAIRLTKKYFDDEDFSLERISECKEFIKGEWTPALKRIKERNIENFIGTSGTITNLCQMAHLVKNPTLPEITNGLKVSAKDILKVIKSIKEAGKANDIAKLRGLDSTRSDIILAGALIIEFAIEYLDIKDLEISSYALREGIVFDTIQKQKTLAENHHLGNLRFNTIKNLCYKFNQNMTHSEQVAKLSLALFDGLKPLHKLEDSERELLEAAAYLHDVGFFLSHDKHHKHSYYIIKHTMMPGFTNNESEIIANIARYHRKSPPSKNHESFSILTSRNQFVVWILGGILRIAEGLDRRQANAVDDLSIEINAEKVVINLIPNKNGFTPDIELWGANRRRGMLEDKLEIEIKFKISK